MRGAAAAEPEALLRRRPLARRRDRPLGRDKRVAILATGGLSHSVGSLQQGWIDEDFDHRFLGDFCAGRGEALAALSDREIAATGSATGEIRSWIVLAGAFAGRTAEQVMYEPIRGFDTGCAQCLIQ